MNNPDNTKPAAAAEAPAQSVRWSQVLTRLGVIAVVVLLTLAALAVGIPWGRYRLDHVVLSEAAVKGTVTKIGARIEGRIQSVEVEAGQQVSKGEVLLRMDDRHLQAALDRARADLQSAIRELESEKMGVEQTRRRVTLEIERVNAGRKKAAGELEADKSTLAKLEKQYDRIAALVKTGAAAASESDRITGDRDRALGMMNAGNAVLEAAEFNHQKAVNELEGVHVREARLKVLESQIDKARANVVLAEADLDAAVVKAPEDGWVLERIVELGGSAKVGEPMISLWIGRAWVEAWADERDLRKFRVGSPADISLDASPKHKLAGRVEAIGLVTDKQLQPAPVPTTLRAFLHQNAMVPVRIALAEDNFKVQLGLSVLVGIRKESDASEAERTSPSKRLLSATPPSASTKVSARE